MDHASLWCVKSERKSEKGRSHKLTKASEKVNNLLEADVLRLRLTSSSTVHVAFQEKNIKIDFDL